MLKKKKNAKLSYSLEKIENSNNLKKAQIDSEIKKITEIEINQLLEKADLEKGKSFVNKNCASCHDFNMPVKNIIGPSLANVLNRKIGSLSDYKYSKLY